MDRALEETIRVISSLVLVREDAETSVRVEAVEGNEAQWETG